MYIWCFAMRSITCCSNWPSQTSLKEYSFALLTQDYSLYKESNRRTLTQFYSNNHASSCEFSLFSASSIFSVTQLLSFSVSQLPLDILSCRPFWLLSLLAAAMAASLEQALGAAAVLRLHSGAFVGFSSWEIVFDG